MSTFDDVDKAVAERFKAIRKTLKVRDGEFLYSGARCAPDFLGWRFRQNLSLELAQPGGIGWEPPDTLAGEIAEGKHDAVIEATWHDAASAEWYYRFEKDYGRDEPEPDYMDEDSYEDEEPTMKKTTETVWTTDDGTTLLRQKEPGKFSVAPGLCDENLLAELGKAIADALGLDRVRET
jgi:hypothetical protein